MMAQSPLKFNILFDQDAEGSFYVEEGDPEQLLKKYTSRAFLAYQWGCWVTSFARESLQRGLDLAGKNAIYCDTDSVKYTGEVDWSKFNEQCIKDCLRTGAHATDANGVEHYMGVFEPEQTTTFVTLGAKKYAYMDSNGHITITVAGVNKKLGGEYLAAHGGLEAFRNGFIFPYPSGGLESVYNDIPGSRWIYIDGHPWEIGPNVYLKPSTYTLGQTAEYIELLSDPALFDRIRHNHLSTGSAMPWNK